METREEMNKKMYSALRKRQKRMRGKMGKKYKTLERKLNKNGGKEKQE